MELKLKKLPNQSFSVAFLSASKMQELNQKYRKQNYVPNVLSFGQGINEILIRWPLEKGEKLEDLIAHGVKSILVLK